MIRTRIGFKKSNGSTNFMLCLSNENQLLNLIDTLTSKYRNTSLINSLQDHEVLWYEHHTQELVDAATLSDDMIEFIANELDVDLDVNDMFYPILHKNDEIFGSEFQEQVNFLFHKRRWYISDWSSDKWTRMSN